MINSAPFRQHVAKLLLSLHCRFFSLCLATKPCVWRDVALILVLQSFTDPCAQLQHTELLAERPAAAFYNLSPFQPALLNRSFSAPVLGFLPSVGPCSSGHNCPVPPLSCCLTSALTKCPACGWLCYTDDSGDSGLAATGS